VFRRGETWGFLVNLEGLGDLGTQGADEIGTFPCPKINRDGERSKDRVVLCCRT
jgi:hypothetical protein